MKRQVKKGEKGIVIFVPIRRTLEDEDGNKYTVVKSFGTGTVFDISQTEGEDLHTVNLPVSDLTTTSEIGNTLADKLKQFLEQEQVSFAIENTKPAHGYYSPGKKHIAIDEDLSGDQFVKTLTHEVVHYVADHRGFTSREDGETVAEGAAFVVLNHFGIDSSDYTFGYVAAWAQEKEVLTRNLAAIQKSAQTVIDAIGGLP
jgi:antirestriction protein ArdC